MTTKPLSESAEQNVRELAERVDEAVPTDEAFVDVKELVERVLRESGLVELIKAGWAMRKAERGLQRVDAWAKWDAAYAKLGAKP